MKKMVQVVALVLAVSWALPAGRTAEAVTIRHRAFANLAGSPALSFAGMILFNLGNGFVQNTAGSPIGAVLGPVGNLLANLGCAFQNGPGSTYDPSNGGGCLIP